MLMLVILLESFLKLLSRFSVLDNHSLSSTLSVGHLLPDLTSNFLTYYFLLFQVNLVGGSARTVAECHDWPARRSLEPGR